MIRMQAVLAVAMFLVGSMAQAASFPGISHKDLKAAIAEKTVFLVDCNNTDTYARNHIPGAINFSAVKDILSRVLPADKGALIVVYCGNEKCHAYEPGANALSALGYTNVRHYAPGIRGWMNAGEATEAVSSAKTRAALDTPVPMSAPTPAPAYVYVSTPTSSCGCQR